MEEAQRKRLSKQRGVAKGMLTRMQEFIESSSPNSHELQVKLNRLPSILTKFKTAQEQLELNDESDHSEERIHF
jgi:hypothetical protein